MAWVLGQQPFPPSFPATPTGPGCGRGSTVHLSLPAPRPCPLGWVVEGRPGTQQVLSEMGEVTVSLNTNVSPCPCAGEGDWVVCAAQVGWQLSLLPGALLSEGPPRVLTSGTSSVGCCGPSPVAEAASPPEDKGLRFNRIKQGPNLNLGFLPSVKAVICLEQFEVYINSEKAQRLPTYPPPPHTTASPTDCSPTSGPVLTRHHPPKSTAHVQVTLSAAHTVHVS